MREILAHRINTPKATYASVFDVSKKNSRYTSPLSTTRQNVSKKLESFPYIRRKLPNRRPLHRHRRSCPPSRGKSKKCLLSTNRKSRKSPVLEKVVADHAKFACRTVALVRCDRAHNAFRTNCGGLFRSCRVRFCKQCILQTVYSAICIQIADDFLVVVPF